MKRLMYVAMGLLIAATALAQSDREPLFTTADGTKIHYDKIGSGPAVVLIHGFIGNGESWKRTPLRQMLADSGFTVVTLDLRGNGRSDKPHALAAYEHDAEVYDVIALMHYLNLPTYDVVGYSRGAIIAAKLMTVAPKNRVRRVVLGGMGTDFTDPDWVRRRHFYEALARPGSHPDLQPAVDYAVKSGADTVALKWMQKAQPVTSMTALKRVKQPALVIAGDQDEDNGKAADLAAILPNATLATVPGTHNTALATSAFARNVVTFLRK